MRTLKKSISGTLAMVAVIFCYLLLTSCGNGETNSATENTKVEAPGETIHFASLMGDLKAVEQHITAGTDLNQKDEYGSTPLTIAVTFDKTDVAIKLIEAGADLSIRSSDGSTPLHTAAFLCRVDIVKALLEKGADKNVKNSYGSTPIQTVSGRFEDVKPIYEQLSKDLGPLGFKLDYSYLEATRPKIVNLLNN